MTQPSVLSPTRPKTTLAITVVFLATMFLLGTQLFDPRQSSRVLAATGTVTSIVAGLIPALGSRQPRLSRLLLLASMTAAALMFGFLARLVFRGLHGA